VEHIQGGLISKPEYYCNFVLCQPTFIIFGTEKLATAGGHTVSPSNTVFVITLPCKILITTLPICLKIDPENKLVVVVVCTCLLGLYTINTSQMEMEKNIPTLDQNYVGWPKWHNTNYRIIEMSSTFLNDSLLLNRRPTAITNCLQESLAKAKVSARQPWYIGRNPRNRPPLRIAQQYQP